MTLSGLTYIDYVINVTGTAGKVVEKSSSATFVLTIKNPCIDAAYIKIEKGALLSQVYELNDLDSDGLQFVHDPFTIKTVPIMHTLCGEIVYDSTFMTVPISNSIDVLKDPFSDPVGYDKA